MRRALRYVLILTILLYSVSGKGGQAAAVSGQVTYATLLRDLVEVYEQGGDPGCIDADVEALGDDMAALIAAHWKKVYLDPDYHLFLFGKDDPSQLPITGKHAFVVLGYELKNGEMTDELKGRCDAAAEAARAFPESILVCSGGATGSRNPERHTEAGLMKQYLTTVCGIHEERILVDERAKSTAENARNTFVILKAQGIERFTLVTSSYHQRWGQVLYNAMAVQFMHRYGYFAEIVGNFCFDTEPSEAVFLQDDRFAIQQLAEILGLPRKQIEMLPKLVR